RSVHCSSATRRARAAPYPLSLHDALPIWPGIEYVDDMPGDGAGVDDIIGTYTDVAGVRCHIIVNSKAGKLWIRESGTTTPVGLRSEEHTSELQSRFDLVCRLLLEKKKSRR